MSQYQCCILAAGHHRDVKVPCSLWTFINGKSILDWQVSGFNQALPNSRVDIAIGYDFERIQQQFGHLSLAHIVNWEAGGALQSFLQMPLSLSEPVITMYGDTVFHPDTLGEFAQVSGDVVVAVDSVWKQRFSGRGEGDINIAETLSVEPYGLVEYTGLTKFSPRAIQWILENRRSEFEGKNFLDLIDLLKRRGFEVATYDVAGSWAEMNEPNDLVQFILGSKAETLRRIQPKLTKSKICDQYTCTWEQWSNEPSVVLSEIKNTLACDKLIVRSSSSEEDSWDTANAGVFESILDIDATDPSAVSAAISEVFASYGRLPPTAQVLVQPFISDIAMSGVIFTCDLGTGAPYYVVNYDDTSGRTDAVTSGDNQALRTIIVFRDCIEAAHDHDPRLVPLLRAVHELEMILGYSKLDIEFAITNSGEIYTFQVRPIVVKHDAPELSEAKLSAILNGDRVQFERWQKSSPQIVGDFTVFSSMTDWNPAEIIGNRPATLATSLYRHLITDDVWAQQRAEFGYRDVRPSPLVHTFSSQPYIDCRASINSFVPSTVPHDLAQKLVTIYLEKLRDDPQLHDKIELELVFTIWEPTFWDDVKTRFEGYDVSKNELQVLEQALKTLTARALERLDDDISSISQALTSYDQVQASDLSPIEKAYTLIDNCRRFGTLAFSHAARAGFVAVTLLKSLVKQGALSQQRLLEFQASVPTVLGDLQLALSDPSVPMEALIRDFGHLRPGTYDVSQPAYWEDPEFYFRRQEGQPGHLNEFEFSGQERHALGALLAELPTKVSVDDLIHYFGAAIQAREKVKFEFCKLLSAALDQICIFGQENLSLSREGTAYLSFEDISAVRVGNLDVGSLEQLIKMRRADTEVKRLVKLPSFISSSDDFYGFEQEEARANYITQLSITADVAFVGLESSDKIEGMIVVIPNADPGFDWLFSHNIAGLITQYGGANSHMAIRCAELKIPAAIGVGEKVYDSLKEGTLMLDCLKECIEYV